MPIRLQPGFFDIHERTVKLTEMGDPLVALKGLIDWEAFRPCLNVVYDKPRKSNAGAKPIDVLLMFKILVLQQLNNLSDDGIEYQIRDRLSFMRFLGLQIESRVPDAKTIWLFRERLKELNLVEELFEKFHEQLSAQGYVAKAGQIIDATFVEAPRQRNNREENATIKSGEIPQEWHKIPNKLRQKDTDARWAKKNQEKHYGYKNHINADQTNKLVQKFAVSDAALHDSQVFEELVDPTADAKARSGQYMQTAHTVPMIGKTVWSLMDLKVGSMKRGRGTILSPTNKRRQIGSSQRLGLGWNTYLGHSTQWEAIWCAPSVLLVQR